MASLIPDAATYGTQQAYAQQAYDKAKSNIKNNQLGWLKQYGMTADYNPTSGAYENYRTDAYNPYGLLQQNRTSEAMDLNSAQDNSIARGISGPGLGNQQASQLHYQHGVQDTNLGNSFLQGMTGFNQNLSDAANTYQQSLFQAENDAIQRALANQEFDQYSQYDNSDGTDAPMPGAYDNTGGYIPGASDYASGGQSDPWTNLSKLSTSDLQKIAAKAAPKKTTVQDTRKKVAASLAGSGKRAMA